MTEILLWANAIIYGATLSLCIMVAWRYPHLRRVALGIGVAAAMMTTVTAWGVFDADVPLLARRLLRFVAGLGLLTAIIELRVKEGEK